MIENQIAGMPFDEVYDRVFGKCGTHLTEDVIRYVAEHGHVVVISRLHGKWLVRFGIASCKHDSYEEAVFRAGLLWIHNIIRKIA